VLDETTSGEEMNEGKMMMKKGRNKINRIE
jgi:hypothetical protein